LVNSLEHYESVFDAIEEGDSEAMSELYQNLEIVRIGDPDSWKTRPRPKQTYLASNRKSQYERRKQKLERGPEWKREQQRELNASRQQAFRDRLKGQRKLDYNRKGRKRAARSKKK
jgi:ketosteroid isomerase-like protein